MPPRHAHLVRSRSKAALIAAFVFSAVLAHAEDAPPSESGTEVTPWQVYLALERHCAECHGGHVAKPKADLGYILDLRRLIAENYVRPRQPDDSDLYTVLITDDPDLHMPPADSDVAQPEPETIELIRQWIAAGAPLHDGTASPAAAAAAAGTAATTTSAVTPRRMPLPRLLGRLHPLVVHFPIALLLCALAAETAVRFRPSQSWLTGMARGCLWIGFAGAVVAAAFGWLNARYEGYAGGEVDVHRWLGIGTAVLAMIALIASERAERATAKSTTTRRPLAVLIVLIGLAVLVSLAGHTGGLLAYGKDYLWKF